LAKIKDKKKFLGRKFTSKASFWQFFATKEKTLVLVKLAIGNTIFNLKKSSPFALIGTYSGFHV
jgi:hypothetical protein